MLHVAKKTQQLRRTRKNTPIVHELNFSLLEDEYASNTILLRVATRLMEANDSTAESFTYEAFRPCIEALISGLSRSIPCRPSSVRDFVILGELESSPVDTTIDIPASSISSSCMEETRLWRHLWTSASLDRYAPSCLNKLWSELEAKGRSKRSWVPCSDALLWVAVVLSFLLSAKFISHTITMPVATHMPWTVAAPEKSLN